MKKSRVFLLFSIAANAGVTLTLGHLCRAQACLSHKEQFVQLLCSDTVHFLVLAQLGEVCFGTVLLLRHEHKHRFATWT